MKNIIFCITGGVSNAFSQQKAKLGMDQELLLKNKEGVFIHYNSTYLIAGESLYYKFNSRNVETGKLKDHSKQGYVELIGKDGKSVLRHHIPLENGTGYGDFFIPSTITSGTCKLIGFTMCQGRNDPYSIFFIADNGEVKAYQSFIIPIPIPTINYNFKF